MKLPGWVAALLVAVVWGAVMVVILVYLSPNPGP